MTKGAEPPDCGKRRYDTREDALETAAHRVGTRGTRTRFLRIYQCPACGGWHLTKKPKRQR